MGEKIIVGPVSNGWKTNLKPFYIDNDSFPTLTNAFQFRGRVKRKRGTELVTRLSQYFKSAEPYTSVTSFVLDGSAEANLFTVFSIPTTYEIVPGSVTLTDTTSTITYTDSAEYGVLNESPPGNTGTINYVSGDISISGAAGNTIDTVSFKIYPCLPVMGLKDYADKSSAFDKTIGFDTNKAYNITTTIPHDSYNISYYKNPSTTASYTAKTTWTKVSWNGENYQQFWTVNYQNSMWATNGISIPYDRTNVGMQYNTITAVSIGTAGNGTTIPAVVTITTGTNHGLVIGDFVFINEILGMTGINFQTGFVTAAPALNQITVTFPTAIVGGAWSSGGIVQYLTNNSDTTKDCLRWFDGFPVDSNTPPNFVNGYGWVNFCPPLSKSTYSIGDLPPGQWYLVSARMIVPFKDRLLAFGAVVQTSAADSQRFIQDICIYSQNGTPYYTVSFNGEPENPTNPTPVLVAGISTPTPSSSKDGQTASAAAFFSDVQGFGGFVQAGVDQNISSVSSNEDALIVGFNPSVQTRFVYTGDDIFPFNFFLINSELGSYSPFATINFDDGVLTAGPRGFVMTAQTKSQRFDESIINQIFEIRLKNNGSERLCAVRDFQNELVYINSNSNKFSSTFPNQSYVYNYREGSWAQNFESYTTYGQFRETGGLTWATIGTKYPTWSDWTDSWESGGSTESQPLIIAGNQQGFVVIKTNGTGEAVSLTITNITQTQITCTDHGLNTSDFVIISNVIGTISQFCNNQIFRVVRDDDDTLTLIPPLDGTGTYLGGGNITRLYRPFIQTKQFPTAWGMGRKTRLGPQQYLFTETPSGEVQILIYLSQDDSNPYNDGVVVPTPGSINNSLIYSTTMYTCVESTNLGLTPANTNLQMIAGIGDGIKPAASPQQQIWHRMNTSLIGDTVQIGITMSDDQMASYSNAGEAITITNITQAYPAVITANNDILTNSLIYISGVVGMIEINEKYVNIISRTATTITIDYDTTAFTAYSSNGTAQPVKPVKQFSEIELHGFILDVNPSSLLA